MAIRLSGMASGLDTDTIVKGLVDAQKLKNKKVSDKSQILDWKKDKLKELNTKLYKLYSEDLTKLRLSSAYSTKKVSSSNENVVTVTGNNGATVGSHTVSNIKMASSQFLTSDTLKDVSGNGNAITTSSKLVENLGLSDGTLIKVETKDGQKTFDVNENSTVADFVQFCKTAGINASFDAQQNRLFLSSKNSGKDNWFTLSASNDSAINSRREIDNAIDFSSLSAGVQSKVNDAYNTLKNADEFSDEYNDASDFLKDLAKEKVKNDAYKEASETIKNDLKKAIEDGKEYTISSEIIIPADVKKTYVETYTDEIRKKYELDENAELSAEQKIELDVLVKEAIESRVITELNNSKVKEVISNEQAKLLSEKVDGTRTREEKAIIELSTLMDRYTKGTVSESNGQLEKLGLCKIELEIGTDGNKKAVSESKNFKEALDSSVTYNGVTLTSSTNTISVNGLTINIKGESNDPINLTVSNDAQTTFDTIKNFITNYNSILKELNTLYYADSARGYDPLSDDEKEAMTEAQIEKWESKIKDSMLRRDSNIGTLISTLKTSMMQGITASDGKQYSLASFGIGTSTDYSEKGLLHINGDPDDAAFSNDTNKLMQALESDPDIVAEVLSKTISNLYKEVDKNIKAIPNVRSAFTFYNDKLMTNQQTEYKKKITELDKKVTELENKYYKQFTAMETAMAKLQSQSNALAGMLGTGTN